MPRGALVLSLLAMCAGCTWFSSRETVLITSEPLGASIRVDGEDTGQTTPTSLPIGGLFGGNHVITLHKPGYRPAARILVQYTEGYTSKWIDGAFDIGMPPLPFFWTAGDFVFPFGVRAALMPAELFVRLEAEDAPLLGFDVLAQRNGAAKR